MPSLRNPERVVCASQPHDVPFQGIRLMLLLLSQVATRGSLSLRHLERVGTFGQLTGKVFESRRSSCRTRMGPIEERSLDDDDPVTAASKHAEGLKAFAVKGLNGAMTPVIDIGVNLGKVSRSSAELQLRRAVFAGVTCCIATGTTVRGSRKSLDLCHWLRKQPKSEVGDLFCTAGVHPHYASDASERLEDLARVIQKLYEDPACVAIGECGLDYDRMRSSRDAQLEVFAAQANLAAKLGAPLFCHERDLDADKGDPLGSHDDFCRIIKKSKIRPERVCVHCYTGSEADLIDYVERGFMIGVTGFVGMHRRGSHVRNALANGVVPLDQLMVETDAPYMKPDKTYLPKDIGLQRQNEPCVTPAVVRAVSELLKLSAAEVALRTTNNARRFFGID